MYGQMIAITQTLCRMATSQLAGPIITGYIWLIGAPRLSFLTSPKFGNDIVVESIPDAETTARYVFGNTFGTTWFASIAMDSTL